MTASITTWGFSDVAAESRYTNGRPCTMRCRVGKSLRISSTSTLTGLASSNARGQCRSRVLGPGRFELLVTLGFQGFGQVRAAGLDDPAAHHHVDLVGGDVVEDPRVVRDQQHAEVLAA